MSSVYFFPVWSTLTYFDIFCYPLREDEIVRYCHHESQNRIEVRSALNQLIEEGLVFKIDDYYSLRNDPEIIRRREGGNARAVQKWEKAKTFASIIQRFPFIRGVWISGSLSKDFMDEYSDIDYFLITKKGRLWFTRTLMILFKKTVLRNSHKHFCVNYFIDEENLIIKERNLFTATELLTLRPLSNENLYEEFLNKNIWANEYLPGFRKKPFEALHGLRETGFKKNLESFLEFFPLNAIDSLFLKITKNHWNKKFKYIPEHLRNQQLRSEKEVSKHHPQGYQNKVMRLYYERLEKSPDWILQEEQLNVHVA